MAQTHEEIDLAVSADAVSLPGTLFLAPELKGLVLFVHGSGSSRFSRRNRAVASDLVDRGFASFLFDLLTEREAMDRRNVFDIPLLATRVMAATTSLSRQHQVRDLPVGYFGASTGAAAALLAAAEIGDGISAVVSRGGRPDLAGEDLPQVTAPTLLIVGSLDGQVIDLNRAAQARLTCENRLEIVEGATHLFEEPGKLEEVSRLAGDWFDEHFRKSL